VKNNHLEVKGALYAVQATDMVLLTVLLHDGLLVGNRYV